MKSVLLSALAVCVLTTLAPNSIAQDNEHTSFVPAQITVTPHVTPPPEVVETGLGGTVRVKISIDAGGTVTSADDVIGPDFTCRQVTRADVVAMRDAAKAAALTARFSPATDKGVPVASSTWLSFKFPGRDTLPSYNAASAAPAGTDKMTMRSTMPETAGSKESSSEKMAISAARVPSAGSDAPTPAPVKGTREIPKQINGGVINGKATYLAKPPYPAAARAVRASGGVLVQVVIDEDGSVFSSQAIEGHPLLRAASVAAACESKFSPTQLAGQPVRVAGIITYNFVP